MSYMMLEIISDAIKKHYYMYQRPNKNVVYIYTCHLYQKNNVQYRVRHLDFRLGARIGLLVQIRGRKLDFWL